MLDTSEISEINPNTPDLIQWKLDIDKKWGP
jgi:hypothetical protein